MPTIGTVPQRTARRAAIAEVEVMGRKAKFTSPDDMEKAIDAYFACQDNYCEIRYEFSKAGEKTEIKKHKPRPYTIAGLVLYLGFATRESLNKYATFEGYGEVINRAFLRIEEQLSENLSDAKGAIAGPIFALKCAFGWQEEGGSPHNVTNNVQINVEGNLGLAGMPPAPRSLEEWTEMYNAHIGVKVPELPQGLDDVEDASYVEVEVDELLGL